MFRNIVAAWNKPHYIIQPLGSGLMGVGGHEGPFGVYRLRGLFSSELVHIGSHADCDRWVRAA